MSEEEEGEAERREEKGEGGELEPMKPNVTALMPTVLYEVE